MIAKLSGLLDSAGTDHAIIDCGGVGYLVFCSARTLRRLGDAGTAVTLRIETHVREDHIHLYGFIDAAERDWFRVLTTVQGVGSKVALALLSVLEPDRLTQAIAAQDKTAAAPATVIPGAVAAVGPPAGSATGDAVSALVNLGYRRAEAFTAVATAAQRIGPDAKVEDLIRAGLKELSA
jgi:holliday junction DNA helicase RuvA